ncbi:MAG: BON domain-containing protein [Chloroflexota bacterium]
MDDADLAREVRDALTYVGGVDQTYLQIRCHDGVVLLSGIAFSEAERHEAEAVASTVPGVRRVVNELTLVAPRAE